MATFTQLPGTLDLAFVRGDEVYFSAAFAGLDLTGYTLTAGIYNSSLNAVTNLVTPTLTLTTATVGSVITSTVAVGLTETQTATLSTAARNRWYLRWVSPGGVTRTVVSGNVTLSNP